jgi:hypothetical protein
VIRKQFEEEAAEGMMIKTTLSAASKTYGKNLVIPALGAIEKSAEKDEWRVIFDGVHYVLLNHRIRVRDQMQFPTWADIASALEVMSGEKAMHVTVLFDIKKALRLIPIAKQDWGLLGRGLDDETREDVDSEIWLNTCGTFGVVSAGYWWGRWVLCWVACSTTTYRVESSLHQDLRGRREDSFQGRWVLRLDDHKVPVMRCGDGVSTSANCERST